MLHVLFIMQLKFESPTGSDCYAFVAALLVGWLLQNAKGVIPARISNGDTPGGVCNSVLGIACAANFSSPASIVTNSSLTAAAAVVSLLHGNEICVAMGINMSRCANFFDC